jgi:hypothetical protein
MESAVLAQHQVAEFVKLKDRYVKWLTNEQHKSESSDLTTAICLGQTAHMLRLFIDDLTFILEQK